MKKQTKNLYQNLRKNLDVTKFRESTKENYNSGFIIIRLSDEYSYTEGDNLLEISKRYELMKLYELLEQSKPKHVRRQISSASVSQLAELEKSAYNSDFPPLRSLSNYWRLDYRDYDGELERLAVLFQKVFEVDHAYVEQSVSEPVVNAADDNFSAQQGYLNPAPEGIDAEWAWTQGFEGQGVGFIDLEQGWIPSHEDLVGASPNLIFNDNRHGVGTYLGNHGTAVLGEVVGVDNALGIVGIAPSVSYVSMVSHYESATNTNLHVADAIVAAIVNMNPGDVLLLEVQRSGGLPTEIDVADFDAIRLAVSKGVIVVEAAGNGSNNLDTWTDPSGDFRLNRTHNDFQDSGAIIVGAALSALPHDRAGFSTFGSRIDCYAWGENVMTAGYGTFSGGMTATRNDDYTSTFNGTSAASPIIVGAALILQGAYRGQTGTILSPLQMRALLSNPATGTAQGPNVAGNIGVMPDLRDIIENTLEITPDIYLRDNVGDTGIVPATGSISASPDIIVRNNQVANPTASFGEGSGNENSNSLGHTVQGNQDNFVYVRMKNRGSSAANNATATVYWSEVATLITPNMWNLIGTSDPVNVPVGNTLVVTNPIRWDENDIPGTGHYCFVGMIDHAQDAAPPVPPANNFDWDDFRAFVRNNNNVTWRNFNVEVPPSDDPKFRLPFNIVGTPDERRLFDIEIVRMVPKYTQIIFCMPYDLFKLSNFKGLAVEFNEKEEEVQVLLPDLKRIYLRNIPLGKEMHKCKFLVNGKEGYKRGTHHLFIRQLFKEEEVGRVTWAFKPKSDEREGDDCVQQMPEWKSK